MPQGMKPRSRRVKMATKPIRKAVKKFTEGMTKLKKMPPEVFMTGPRRIKTDGRITKEDMEKYMKKNPREFQTGIPRPMPRDPKKVPEFRPMPRPMPGPMPRPRRLPRDLRDLLEKYRMKEPRKIGPAMKKDGGEMMGLKSALSKAASGAMGVSAEKLKQAFEQAKKIKPSGRLNMDDIKKALGMMGAAKKTEPKIKGRSGGPKTAPKRRTLRKLI